VKDAAKTTFLIIKEVNELPTPEKKSVTESVDTPKKKKKDKKAAKKLEKSQSWQIATPRPILERVEDVFVPAGKNKHDRKIDDDLRFKELFRPSLFKNPDVLEALVGDPTGRVDDPQVTAIMNNIRPRKNDDLEEVGALYQKLANIIREILETDHHEDIETRKRRISYANWAMSNSGGGKLVPYLK